MSTYTYYPKTPSEEYTFYSGNVTVNSNGDFGTVSIHSYSDANGFAGCENIFSYMKNYNVEELNSGAVSVSSSNNFLFNGIQERNYDSHKKYFLTSGASITLTGIPQTHPFAILNNGNSNITYTGDNNKKTSQTVSGTTNDAGYDFYYGDVTITVSGDFGCVSGYTSASGVLYAGMRDIFNYLEEPFVSSLERPESVVSVVQRDSANKYVFNGDTSYSFTKKYALFRGVYKFKGISTDHPMAILNNGNPNITYTGDSAKKSSKAVTGTTNDATYDFYHGDITVTVRGDFGTVSIYCYNHGYMGGHNLLFYQDMLDTATPRQYDLLSIPKTAVKVIDSGGNKYVFNNDRSYTATKKYGLHPGIYTFSGIPSNHPLAILNHGKTDKISYTGDSAKKSSKAVTGTTNDATYDFYHGDITVTVHGDFGTVSIYCFHHGYMGGQDLLKFLSLTNLESLNKSSAVSANSNNVLMLNGASTYDTTKRYGLVKGTYTLTGVPSGDQSVAVLNNGVKSFINFAGSGSPTPASKRVVINERRISGLNNGRYYNFRIAAENEAGISEYLTTTSTTYTRGAPSNPRSLSTTPQDQKISLNWLRPLYSGGVPITGYKIYYKKTTSGLPGPPTNLSVTTDSDRAVISWNPPANTNNADVTSYKLMYKKELTGSILGRWITNHVVEAGGSAGTTGITVSASTNSGDGNKAFNNTFTDATDIWSSSAATYSTVNGRPSSGDGEWIKVQFTGGAKKIARYDIGMPNDGGTTPFGTYPMSWKVEGSNDNAAWTILSREKNICHNWAQKQYKYFAVESPGSYVYYRITFTKIKNGGDNFASIGNVILYSTTENTTGNIVEAGAGLGLDGSGRFPNGTAYSESVKYGGTEATLYTNYNPRNAFNGVLYTTGDYWEALENWNALKSTIPPSLGYAFPAKKKITKYRLWTECGDNTKVPTGWELRATNNPANYKFNDSSTYTTLDTQSDEKPPEPQLYAGGSGTENPNTLRPVYTTSDNAAGSTYSSGVLNGLNSDRAFNGTSSDSNDAFHSINHNPVEPNDPAWIAIKFPGTTTKKITKYKLWSRNDSQKWQPVDWEIRGVATGVTYTGNSTSASHYTVLDTVTGETTWEQSNSNSVANNTEYKEFEITTPGYYNTYVINITNSVWTNSNSNGSYTCIGEWALYYLEGTAGNWQTYTTGDIRTFDSKYQEYTISSPDYYTNYILHITTGQNATNLSVGQLALLSSPENYSYVQYPDANTAITDVTAPLTYTVSNLEKGCKYKFKVLATNSEGTETTGAETSNWVTINSAFTTLDPPTDLIASGHVSTKVTLSWADPETKTESIASGSGGYKIEKIDMSATTPSWTEITAPGDLGTITEYEVTEFGGRDGLRGTGGSQGVISVANERNTDSTYGYQATDLVDDVVHYNKDFWRSLNFRANPEGCSEIFFEFPESKVITKYGVWTVRDKQPGDLELRGCVSKEYYNATDPTTYTILHSTPSSIQFLSDGENNNWSDQNATEEIDPEYGAWWGSKIVDDDWPKQDTVLLNWGSKTFSIDNKHNFKCYVLRITSFADISDSDVQIAQAVLYSTRKKIEISNLTNNHNYKFRISAKKSNGNLGKTSKESLTAKPFSDTWLSGDTGEVSIYHKNGKKYKSHTYLYDPANSTNNQTSYTLNFTDTTRIVDYIVIGGGAAGGSFSGGVAYGGGGAGGVQVVYQDIITAGNQTVLVGGGGIASGHLPVNGYDSSFNGKTGYRGGHGSGNGGPSGSSNAGGAANQGNTVRDLPTSSDVAGGYAGGNGTSSGEKSGGSGGGARSAGENSKAGAEDVGGAGIPNDFRDGTYQWYAGGGGGGRETQTSSSITYGSEPGGGANASRVGVPYSLYKDRGGHGGIGVSGDAHFLAPVSGHSDTGNGGGAGGNDNDSTGTVGGNGGSGIVIIRYEIPTSE